MTVGLLILVCNLGWLVYADDPEMTIAVTPSALPVVAWQQASKQATAVAIPTMPPPQPQFQIEVTHHPLASSISTPESKLPQPAMSNSSLLSMSPLQGWPVEGPISQSFGCSNFDTQISGAQAGCSAARPYYHDGLDIAVPMGTPIRSSITGTVLFAGSDGAGPICNDGYRGYGLGIVIDDGAGWQVLYAHLSEIYVRKGETVSPSQIIGLSGNTGCSSGPHLHFGMRHQGHLVDPQIYLE